MQLPRRVALLIVAAVAAVAVAAPMAAARPLSSSSSSCHAALSSSVDPTRVLSQRALDRCGVAPLARLFLGISTINEPADRIADAAAFAGLDLETAALPLSSSSSSEACALARWPLTMTKDKIHAFALHMDSDMAVTEERVLALIARMDTNADRELDLAEFMVAHRPRTTLSPRQDDAKLAKNLADDRIFAALDDDDTSGDDNNNVGDPILPDHPTQLHIALTNNASEMMVNWATLDKCDSSTVQVGLSEGKYNASFHGTIHTYTADGWKGWLHVVTVTGLQPDTTYHYRVGDDKLDKWSDDRYFTTYPSKPRPATIAIYGDQGVAIPAGFLVSDMVVKDHKTYDFQAIVHVGDLAYASTRATPPLPNGTVAEIDPHLLGGEWEFVWDAWVEQISGIGAYVPYMAGVGNHEKFFDYTSYLSRFSMPAPWGYDNSTGNMTSRFWFGFDVSYLHFTMMSSEHDYTVGSEQYNWIERDLALARSNPNTPWIILTGHRPMLCSDENELDSHVPGSQFLATIEPLMIKYKVDMYIPGHMHCYEAIHPNINGSTPYNSTELERVYHNPGMPAHVVQGTAGAFTDLHYVNPPPAWSAARHYDFGYGRMSVNVTHLHYEYIELDAHKVQDSFWIIKD